MTITYRDYAKSIDYIILSDLAWWCETSYLILKNADIIYR